MYYVSVNRLSDFETSYVVNLKGDGETLFAIMNGEFISIEWEETSTGVYRVTRTGEVLFENFGYLIVYKIPEFTTYAEETYRSRIERVEAMRARLVSSNQVSEEGYLFGVSPIKSLQGFLNSSLHKTFLIGRPSTDLKSPDEIVSHISEQIRTSGNIFAAADASSFTAGKYYILTTNRFNAIVAQTRNSDNEITHSKVFRESIEYPGFDVFIDDKTISQVPVFFPSDPQFITVGDLECPIQVGFIGDDLRLDYTVSTSSVVDDNDVREVNPTWELDVPNSPVTGDFKFGLYTTDDTRQILLNVSVEESEDSETGAVNTFVGSEGSYPLVSILDVPISGHIRIVVEHGVFDDYARLYPVNIQLSGLEQPDKELWNRSIINNRIVYVSKEPFNIVEPLYLGWSYV